MLSVSRTGARNCRLLGLLDGSLELTDFPLEVLDLALQFIPTRLALLEAVTDSGQPPLETTTALVLVTVPAPLPVVLTRLHWAA